jgi:hypothetical protein
MQEWLNIYKSVSAVEHISRSNLDDYLKSCRKYLQQNSTPLPDKSPEESRNRTTITQHIEITYHKPISNVILNEGKTENIFPKLRNKTRMFTLTVLINYSALIQSQ